MAKRKKNLANMASALTVAAGVAKIVADFVGRIRDNDLGCDWYCDNCGAELNTQLGFRAGSTWTCKECGYLNDVSTDNIIEPRKVVDDSGRELDVLDLPAPGDWEDPEDY